MPEKINQTETKNRSSKNIENEKKKQINRNQEKKVFIKIIQIPT